MLYCFGPRGRMEGSREGGPARRRSSSVPRLAALKPQVAADPDYLLSPKTKPAEGPWGRGEIEKGGGVKGREGG